MKTDTLRAGAAVLCVGLEKNRVRADRMKFELFLEGMVFEWGT